MVVDVLFSALLRHMHFSYDVELPLGSWDCKTGPLEPKAELLSPEDL